MRLVKGSLAGLVLNGILEMMPAPGLMGQTTVHIALDQDCQVKNKLPVTGQPEQGLNALLGR